MSNTRGFTVDYELGDIYKQLFEAAGEGLIISDSNGEIILANPSANNMFGYNEYESLQGKRIEDLVPDNLRHRHSKHREGYISSPSKRTMGAGLTLFAKRKNGSQFPVEISLNHFGQEGETFVMSMITDVTRKWQMDNQIRKEKETAQLYLDVASAIFLVIDKDENVELLNRSGQELLGVSEDEAIGKNWFESYVHPEDREIARGYMQKAWKGSVDFQNYFEFRVVTKDKGDRIISWLDSAVRDEKREIRAVLCSGQDVTDRKEAEQKLKEYTAELEERVESRTWELSRAVEDLESANSKLGDQNKEIIQAQRLLQDSQKLYKIIARNFPKGTISVFDKNLDYVFVEGKELYEMGVTSEMLIGTNLIDRLSPEIKDSTREALKEVFKGEAKKIDVKLRDNFYVLNAVPLTDDDGSVGQIMVVEQNITESKLAEENIKKALKKERDLGDLKSRFVSMASHEFRTPLSTILSSVSLIQKYIQNNNTERTEKHIHRVKSSVANLTNILNDFLSLGKLEEGKVILNAENLNILEWCEEVAEEMQGQAKEGQILNYRHEGGEQLFLVDRGILRNIITNLLSNAIKYSPEDSDVDFISTIDGDDLQFKVRDSGIGIPLEEQKFLFERFFRAKNAANIQGTGLGLNIVKKYVDLMDGEVSFSSTENEGTTFTVIFDQNEIKKLAEEND